MSGEAPLFRSVSRASGSFAMPRCGVYCVIVARVAVSTFPNGVEHEWRALTD